jgi:hypothetical protein
VTNRCQDRVGALEGPGRGNRHNRPISERPEGRKQGPRVLGRELDNEVRMFGLTQETVGINGGSLLLTRVLDAG